MRDTALLDTGPALVDPRPTYRRFETDLTVSRNADPSRVLRHNPEAHVVTSPEQVSEWITSTLLPSGGPDRKSKSYRCLRELRSAGTLAQELQVAIDEAICVLGDLWWLSHSDASWQRRIEALEAYVAENDSFPSKYATNPATAEVGLWLQKMAATDVSAERKAQLDRILPNWDNQRESHWRGLANQVANFVASNGRFPGFVGGSEGRLAVWLKNQALAAQGIGHIASTPERRALLDSLIPGWTDPAEALWRQRLALVVAFQQTNDRLPRKNVRDDIETSLKTWLDSQSPRKNGASASRLRVLDEKLPGWRPVPRDELWTEKAEAVRSFLEGHARWPANTDDPDRRDEYLLARWCRIQAKEAEANSTRWSTNREAVMMSIDPQWRQRSYKRLQMAERRRGVDAAS